jgi:DNA-binding NarL/FixJ family response regulator
VADEHELVRGGLRGLLGARRGWTVVGETVNGREAVEKQIAAQGIGASRHPTSTT